MRRIAVNAAFQRARISPADCLSRHIFARPVSVFAKRESNAQAFVPEVLHCRVARRGVSASVVVTQAPFEVVQSHSQGLLLRSSGSSSASGFQEEASVSLQSGSVVLHEGEHWMCVFEVDRYWFATRLDRDIDVDGAVACLNRSTPVQAERSLLTKAMSTGVIAVDVLAPIGTGQSMLICGSKGSGKSMLTREILEYVLTSGVCDKVIRFTTDPSAPLIDAAVYRANSFMDVPMARINDGVDVSASLTSLFATIGTAEVIRDRGSHVLLVIDSLTPLLTAWDLGNSWAENARGEQLDKEGIATQRRKFFSSILERAANLKTGGSLTLVGVLESDSMAAILTPSVMSSVSAGRNDDQGVTFSLDDFSGRKEAELQRLDSLLSRNVALTPANLKKVGIQPPGVDVVSDEAVSTLAGVTAARELQSLSDGQVVLDRMSAEKGAYPAVEVGASFSRFGLGGSSTSGDVDAPKNRKPRDVRPPALQAVAAHLRTNLALEREVHFRPESSDGDVLQSTRMAAVRSVLLQPTRAPVKPEEMTALLLAACSGALDCLPQDAVLSALSGGGESSLLRHIRQFTPDVLEQLGKEDGGKAVAAKLDVQVRVFVAVQKATLAAESR